jgi:hypothetical protein
MRFKKMMAWGISVLVLVVAVCLWVRHGVDAAIRNVTSNQDLKVAAKSTVASLAVAGEKLEPESSARQPQQGALDRYAQDPKKAESDARLTDTWTSGLVIADVLLSSTQAKSAVGSSDDIPGLDSKFQVDGWGHRFCYSLQPNMAILFSGGDIAGFRDCQKWNAPTNVTGLPRGRLVKTAEGGFLLIVVRG